MAVNQSNMAPPGADFGAAEGRLYLRDEELDRGVALIFAASRQFWRVAGAPLEQHDLGQAHYRALAAIRRTPNVAVGALQRDLGVRKQSLQRVLKELEDAALILRQEDSKDRRVRLLSLTQAGLEAEQRTSDALRTRLAEVFKSAGPQAVAGMRAVLERLAGETP
jgi:DNA-binding MarR family transcriptional regulator